MITASSVVVNSNERRLGVSDIAKRRSGRAKLDSVMHTGTRRTRAIVRHERQAAPIMQNCAQQQQLDRQDTLTSSATMQAQHSNQDHDERLISPAGSTTADQDLAPDCFEKQPMKNSSTKARCGSFVVSLKTQNRRPQICSRHIAILIACGLSLCLLTLADLSSSARHPVAVVATDNALNQQQRALLRSANVELTRRSLQRAQRESPTASSNSIDQQQQQPTCGYPGSPAHASVTFNTTHVVAGTAASYACDNGYELLGPPRRICQPNGSWSPVGIPFCVLNVGLGKAAMQSSTAGHGSAQKAVDGSTSPYFQASTCTMTDVEHNPWWYVNLLEPYLVQIVRIDFGQACCANRQKATIAVRVGNNRPDLGNNPLCNRYHGFIEEGKPLFLPCTRPAPGAFVSIHLESPSGSSLSICETFIYTDHALSIEQCPSFRDQPLGSTATYNGKCYLFHNNQALDFDGARKYCESRGGTLVDETSPALQGFLSWELYRRHRNDQLMGQYWLGAIRDQRQPQNWKWISGNDVQISFWNSLASQGNCSRFDGSKGWLWSDTDCSAQLNFICQHRPLSCGKPEKPTNSTLITKNIDNGTVIEYQCAPGNLLMGPKSRVCLPTGFFSEFAPKCKYLDCQFPAMIPNGDYKLLNSSTAYQSMVKYYCNEGYQIYGISTLTCDVDERWNGPPPRCEPLLCSAPVAPSNGYVTVTSNITIPGTQATYDCRPGYELVGDRLLSCLPSGSWDNSFPYCREKRQTILPHVLQLPGDTNGGLSAPNRPATAVPARPASGPTNVQFPASNANVQRQHASQMSPSTTPKATPAASSATTATTTTIPATTSSSSSTTTTTTTVTPSTTIASGGAQHSSTSLPASLNGLAGQFVVTPVSSGAPPSGQQVSPSLNEIPTSSTNEQQQQQQAANQRRPAVMAPMATNNRPVSSVQQQMSSGGGGGGAPMVDISSSAQATTNSAPTSSSFSRQSGTSNAANRPSQFVPTHTFGSQNGASSTSSAGGYDSLATTNSISIHHSSLQQPSQQQSSSPIVSTTSNSPTTSSSIASSNTHFSSPASTHFATSGGSSSTGQPGNVMASFGAPTSSVRHHMHAQAHNALANTKYSLDGIIAVAIFGGFIFLGAIITILVIIIRRKSSQSSSIDAQTISTYDSAGGNDNHNGLYRNYQQAWDNLRFATPASQPKLSGNGPASNGANGVSLITAHVSGGPSIGLKNYASPSVMLHHHHHHPQHHHMHAHANGGGHNNLAMSSSVDSSSSSASSSSLGANGGAGSGGADPLLGPSASQSLHHGHHHHHHHHHASAHHHTHHHGRGSMIHGIESNHQQLNDDDIDEDDDEDEQGIISADEANYAPRHFNASQLAGAIGHAHHAAHTAHLGHDEGFRDTNEMTINADTAPVPNNIARRRLCSVANIATGANNASSIGRNSLAFANRRSLGSLNQQATDNDQQHQRLVVTSSNSSNSARSSRASPPSDDQSLDRLAYGSNWHNKQNS